MPRKRSPKSPSLDPFEARSEAERSKRQALGCMPFACRLDMRDRRVVFGSVRACHFSTGAGSWVAFLPWGERRAWRIPLDRIRTVSVVTIARHSHCVAIKTAQRGGDFTGEVARTFNPKRENDDA